MIKQNVNRKARLNIEIERDIRDKFLGFARLNNTDGSKLIRDFIYKYVKKNEEGKNDNRRD